MDEHQFLLLNRNFFLFLSENIFILDNHFKYYKAMGYHCIIDFDS